MDCTQVLVESDEEDNVAEEDDRRQVASLTVNGDSFPIFLGENKIGRDASTCSVVISSLALTSQHAVIQGLECGMFLIRDLNSRNKTKIGKMTLTPNVRYQLKSGDAVRFANVSCTFHVERDARSNSTSSEKDIPCTQAIDCSDNEDAAGCSTEPDFTSNKNSLVKEDSDANRDGVKTPKSIAKKSEEHVFKIPAVTPTRNFNDSFGLLNESKDSSCHADSDDEIFDLLTQPSSEEPTTSELVAKNYYNNVRGQEGENVLPSGAKSEMADDDDIFSAATEDFNVARKQMGSPLTVPKDTDDKDSDESDEGGLQDEDDIFSAATEGFQCKSRKKKKEVSGTSPNIAGVEHISALKEDDANEEEDIFSASTEGFPVKTLKKYAHEAGSMTTKDKDAWEEYGIADEDDIFSAATEGLPTKSDKSYLKKWRENKFIGVNDTSKEDDVTDEDDIFSAATEAIPAQSSKMTTSKTISKNVITKDGDVDEEGDVTDEDDIFSAATEALPTQPPKKIVSKTKARDVTSIDGDASEEGEITDEEDIFSAATEALPAQSSKKKTSKTKAKDFISKDADVSEEDQVTDEDDIFSAATEALPAQSSVKKALKTNSKDVITKDADVSEGHVSDENDIFSAATESLPMQSSEKKALKTKSKDVITKDGDGSEEGDVTDEDDIFSAATEAFPALKSIKKAPKTNPSNAVVKDGDVDEEGQVTDEDDIFSAATEALPLSHGGQNNESNSSISNVVDLKGMQGKNGNCEDDGFVKDFLSISDSEHVGRGGDGSTVEKTMATGNEAGNSQKSACEKQSVVGNSVEKKAQREKNTQEMKSSMESDGGETDVEDDVDSCDIDKKTKTHSALKDVVKESEKSKCDNSDVHKIIIQSASENVLDGDGGSHPIDPNASIIVISDTDGEDEEESYINSTLEKSKENKSVETSAIKSSNSGSNTPVDIAQNETLASKVALETGLDQQSGHVTKTVMMTIDETLPTACVILTSKGSKTSEGSSVSNNTTGNKLHKIEKSNVQKDIASKSSVKSIMGDTGDNNLVSTPEIIQNQSNIIADKDDDEVFVAETPVCDRNMKRGKGLQVSHENEVEEEEDMSSFLTEVPPEFKTPVVGLKRTTSGVEDLSDFEIQPTPKSSVPSIYRKEKGMVEDDDEEEDMSSFLTQVPPEFKTPESVVKKQSTGEEDLSELLTQPAPISSDTHTPSRGNDEEDMSSFLTEVPPEFKTPVTGVKKIIAEEEDDLSDLATQPAPKSTEKEQGDEDEDMSSFLTEAPPKFETPVAGVRKIFAEEEEEDVSDLMTQPAPRSEEKDDEGDIRSFHKEVPPEFKTPMAGIRKLIDEKEDDLSDLATQPAPKSIEQEQGNEEEDTNSFPNEAQPELKIPKVVTQKCVEEEEEDWSDFATQPAPVSEKKQKEEEAGNEKSLSPKAESEFKIPKVFVHNVSSEKEQDEDFSDMATQPAPRCDEKEGEDNKLADAPSELKATKGSLHSISSEGEDFSDLATQPAPVNEEEQESVGEMNLFSPKATMKFKTSGRQERSADEQDDLSELLTQPAPVEGILHSKCVSEKMGVKETALSSARRKRDPTTQCGESSEEDLSFLDTQPAPTSPVTNDPSDGRRKRPPTVNQIRKEERSKGKASSAASSKENWTSSRGKGHLHKNIESPKKGCPSPRGGKKSVNIFADLKTQIEEGDSSDTDFEFSMNLPDTPDLLATLQESGNRYVPDQTTCRNLFDSEKSGKSIALPSTASSKVASKAKTIASKGSETSNKSVQKELIRPDVVKVSAQSKSTFDVKNTTCPPKKPKEVLQKRPGHLDAKGEDLIRDSKGFDGETGVTMAGLNNMQKLKNGKPEKTKSKTVSLLREVVVTSTPIHSSGVSVEPDETPPPGSVTDAPYEKTTKPTRRGRRKGGGVNSDIGHAANNVISPVVCVGDTSDMPSSIKVEDFPVARADAPKKAHNLRLKKSSDSSAAVKAGAKRHKEQALNLQADPGILKLDEISDGSSKGKSLRTGRKRNMPSSVEEVAPVTKVASKSGKGRKKIESSAVSPLSSGDVSQLTECPEKLKISNESNKQGGYLGETSESSNVDGELSPVIFYGKNSKTEKYEKSAVSRTDSSVVALSKKKTQANDSQSEDENSNTSVASPEPTRRSGRERKPKKRFSVDCSPVKPKRNRSDYQSLESIPTSGRVMRGRKGFVDSCTLSDSGVKSSQETVMSSDSTLIISKKRASDDDQSLRSNKKLRISDVESPIKVATRGGSRQTDEEGSSSLKGSMGPPAKKSDDKSKMADGNVLCSRKDPAVAGGESGDNQDVKGDEGGGKDSGKGKRKKDPAIPAKLPRVSTRSKGDEETCDAKQVHSQQSSGKVGRLREKKGSSSEKLQVTIAMESNSQANQVRSSRGRNAASIEKSKRGKNDSTAAKSSKMSSNSVTTVVDEESKDEEHKRTAGSRNSSASRGRRRKLSPVATGSNSKEDKGDVENNEYSLPPKVAPLKISRGRIVSGSLKGSDVVAVDSPVYNKSLLGECVLEETSLRVRKQKKDSVNVLFTGLSDPKLNQIVERLGGSIVETPHSCTVLVTDRLRRTYKLLCAIGRGIPIVTAQWLNQSSSSNKFLDPLDFLVCDKVTEKRFNFSLKSSLEKARAKPMLSGYSFCATPSVKPPPEEVKGIVTCAGGQYVSTLKALDSKVTTLSYVVSCADDSAVWDEYTEISAKKAPRGRAQKGKGASTKEEATRAKLVGVEGLLVSVLRQKPDLDNKEFSLR